MKCRVLVLKKGFHTIPTPDDTPIDGVGNRILTEADIPYLRKGLRGIVPNYSNLPDPVQTGEGVIYIVLNDTIGTGDCYNPEYPKGLYRVENGNWIFWSGCYFSKAQHVDFCEDWADDVNEALILLKIYIETLESNVSSLVQTDIDLYQKISSLKGDINGLKAFVNELSDEVDGISSRVTNNENDINDIQNDIVQIHTTLQLIEDTISSIQAHDDEQDNIIQQINDNINNIYTKIVDIYSDLDEHSSEISDLYERDILQQSQINNLINENIQQEQNINKLYDYHSSQQIQINDLYDKHDVQQEDIDYLIANFETMSSWFAQSSAIAYLEDKVNEHDSLIASMLVDIEQLSSWNEQQDQHLTGLDNDIEGLSSWNEQQQQLLEELEQTVSEFDTAPGAVYISLPGEQIEGTDVAMPIELPYKFKLERIIARCKVVPDEGNFRADIKINGVRILNASTYIEIPEGQERCELGPDDFQYSIFCENSLVTIDVLSGYGCTDVMIQLIGKYYRELCGSSSSSSSSL